MTDNNNPRLAIILIALVMTIPWLKPTPASAQITLPPTAPVDGFFVQEAHASLPTLEMPSHAPREPLALLKVERPEIPGNTYFAGQCTWYAKSRRMDLPNNLGNADTWAARAAAQGWKVDMVPAVGDIGMTRAYMHVVYIEAVNSDGTVLISEMNFKGAFIVNQRVAPVNEFVYIHE